MPKKSENIGELKSVLEEEAGEEEEEEGTEEEEGFVEIDGEKFQEDPENPGEALLDGEENPIPFEEKKEEEEEEEEEGEEKFEMPDKFKDKSPEEIAKSYKELEGMIEKKAEEKAEEITKKKAKEEEEEEEEKETKLKPKKVEKVDWDKVDWKKLTPKEFAAMVDKRIEERATELAEAKAREVMSGSLDVRTEVRKEIKDAQKDHPLLKTNEEYRELVLSIIEAANSKGKKVSLKDACEKVDKLVGKKEKIGETEEKKLKKIRAQVEIDGGVSPGGGKETEGDKIRKGMVKDTNTGDLGGL